nr:MAG TPA: helix-turn-helix domain protein [Caudoviricetes sp.]
MLLTVREVADRIHTNPNYVYDLINSGLLTSIKIGCRKVREETLDEFLREHDGGNVDDLLKEKGFGKSGNGKQKT